MAHKLRACGCQVGGEHTDSGIRLGQTCKGRLVDSGHVVRVAPHRAEESQHVVERVARLQQIGRRGRRRGRAIDHQPQHLRLHAAVARCVERLGAEEVRPGGQREVANHRGARHHKIVDDHLAVLDQHPGPVLRRDRHRHVVGVICHVVQIGQAAVVGRQQVQRGPLGGESVDRHVQRLRQEADVAR